MSHDRGCPCGREPYEYRDCVARKGQACYKWTTVVRWNNPMSKTKEIDQELSKDCFKMENEEKFITHKPLIFDDVYNEPHKQTEKEEAYNAPWYTHFKIQPLDFCVQNNLGIREHAIIKYVCRYPHKGQPLKDLCQARFYIDEIIKELENDGDI